MQQTLHDWQVDKRAESQVEYFFSVNKEYKKLVNRISRTDIYPSLSV
jgi:hypothetical protein